MSEELNPVPGEVTFPKASVKLFFWIPSTKILSPTLKGGVINPSIGGVLNSHSTTPLVYDKTLSTWTPLLLLIVKILWSTSSNPFGSSITSTETIVFPLKLATSNPLFTTLRSYRFTIINDGAEM